MVKRVCSSSKCNQEQRAPHQHVSISLGVFAPRCSKSVILPARQIPSLMNQLHLDATPRGCIHLEQGRDALALVNASTIHHGENKKEFCASQCSSRKEKQPPRELLPVTVPSRPTLSGSTMYYPRTRCGGSSHLPHRRDRKAYCSASASNHGTS